MKPLNPSTLPDWKRGTSSGSAYTPATPWSATRSARRRARVVRGSSTAESTPPCIPKKPMSMAVPMPSSRVTETLHGGWCWPNCAKGAPEPAYEAGQIGASTFKKARWDLLPRERYAWASVQTVRGCPKHCSFCSVWRTDGQEPRQRGVEAVVEEIVELRRMGFRFIALADDNFYPVTLEDLRMARRRKDPEPSPPTGGDPRGAIRADGAARAAAEGPRLLYTDHDGGRRGHVVSPGHEEGPDHGSAGRCRSGHPGRVERHLQGLQLRGRRARDQAQEVSRERRSTSSGRSSSVCRATVRAPSMRPSTLQSERTSRSRSSSRSPPSPGRSISNAGSVRKETTSRRSTASRCHDTG